jgi:hypothetical protein
MTQGRLNRYAGRFAVPAGLGTRHAEFLQCSKVPRKEGAHLKNDFWTQAFPTVALAPGQPFRTNKNQLLRETSAEYENHFVPGSSSRRCCSRQPNIQFSRGQTIEPLIVSHSFIGGVFLSQSMIDRCTKTSGAHAPKRQERIVQCVPFHRRSWIPHKPQNQPRNGENDKKEFESVYAQDCLRKLLNRNPPA